MSGTKGLKSTDRKLATVPKTGKKLTANQWQNTPKQQLFLDLYLDINSPGTFGNSYASAIQAGYNHGYAVKITAPSNITKWLVEYRKRNNYTEDHIKQLLQALANDPEHYNNSKDPAMARIKSMELLSKILGLTDNKSPLNVTLVQPILSGNSVKRKIVDNTSDSH